MKIVHFEILFNNIKMGHFHLVQCLYDSSNICASDMEQTISKKISSFLEEESWNAIISMCTNNSDCSVLLFTNSTTCDCKCLASKNFVSVENINIGTINFLFAFQKTLFNSSNYRQLVLNHFLQLKNASVVCKWIKVVTINISSSDMNAIDYKWSLRLQRLCYEKKEFEKTMTWLSVIGGACSALGDVKIHFADRAGLIAAEQFRLAMKFSDELAMIRCKLYYAQSLIQKGYLDIAKKIIKEQYRFAKKTNDNKLVSMCLGINAKWQYENKRQKHISGNT